MKKLTFILSLSLWIITGNSCEKGTPEDENTPPIIELVQPYESTDIYAGDPFLFEIIISDPDGVISSWVWEVLTQNGEMGWSDMGTPNESSVTLSSSLEFKNADAGDCVLRIMVEDNKMGMSEANYQWEIKDYRDKYIGMWDFDGIKRGWNMNWDPPSVSNPYSYSGSVDYGSTDSTLLLDFCSESGIEIVITHEGEVHILPGGDHLSVGFFSVDSLYLHKLSTARGAGTEYTLAGVKK